PPKTYQARPAYESLVATPVIGALVTLLGRFLTISVILRSGVTWLFGHGCQPWALQSLYLQLNQLRSRDMKVEMRALSSIKPYFNNARLNESAVVAVAKWIKEFGFRQALVVDEDLIIIVGHTRYKAALKLGLTEVPVHVAVGMSKAQAKASRIIDNQTARLS